MTALFSVSGIANLFASDAKTLRAPAVGIHPRILWTKWMSVRAGSGANLSSLGPPFSLVVFAIALLASSRSRWSDMQIVTFVWVALRTMSAFTEALASVATLAIHFVRDQFHVIAINARTKTAQMIRLQSGRNWSTLHNPCGSRVLYLATIEVEIAISFGDIPSPEPASIFQNLDVTHEPLQNRLERILVVSHCISSMLRWSGLRSAATLLWPASILHLRSA